LLSRNTHALPASTLLHIKKFIWQTDKVKVKVAFVWVLTLSSFLNTAALAKPIRHTPENQKIIDVLKRSQSMFKKINGPNVQCDQGILRSSDGSAVVTSDGTPIGTSSYEFSKLNPRLGKVRAASGQEFEISILPLDQAKSLFDEMAAQPHIPFRFPEDGCYARGHEMSKLMEKKGVISGKVFLEGDLRVETPNSPKGYVQWWYHVAPIVLVEKNGKLEPYVIDPSIFSEPVPAEEWFAIQTRHEGGQRQATYMTPRFQYTPSNAEAELRTRYDPRDVDDMRRKMEEYLVIQRERDRLRGGVPTEPSTVPTQKKRPGSIDD
jgi:hypothetical protein